MSKLKRLLPKGLKQFLWFVFKAPQRKIVGFKTWLVDLKGWFSRGMGNGVPGDITICVGLKNRSKHFLEHFLQSLNEVQRTDSFRLSIVDCGSDDIENLESEIRNNWAGVLHFEQKEQEFSRSEVFNKAIKNADTELVFICDADMQLPSDLYFSIKKYVQKRCAWFPVVYHLNEDGNSGNSVMRVRGFLQRVKVS